MIVMQKTKKLLSCEQRLKQSFQQLPKDLLTQRREQAFEAFNVNGLPSQKHEDWQNTPISSLKTPSPASVPGQLPIFDVFEIDFPVINIVDGHIDYASLPKNITIEENLPPSLPISAEDDPLFLINQAFIQKHITVIVKENGYLWLRYLGTQASTASSQIDIQVGSSCELTVIESHGSGHAEMVANHSLGFCVGANAQVKHYKWQTQNKESQHFAHHFFHLGKDAQFSSTSILAGGSLCRQNSFTRLAESGCTSEVNSLYVGSKGQTIDTRTFTKHQAPHCNSYQIHKGILDDDARGVFQGRIYVDPQALKTDGQMDNRALLLSEKAQNNSKPQLEIYADDVKCSHGFTCGQMDKDQLFYIQSRGIPLKEAQKYLMYAFAAEVALRIDYEPMRNAVERALSKQLIK